MTAARMKNTKFFLNCIMLSWIYRSIKKDQRSKESFTRSSRIERVRDEFVSAKTSSGLSKELQTGAFILNLHLILHPFFKLYNPSEQLINRGT